MPALTDLPPIAPLVEAEGIAAIFASFSGLFGDWPEADRANLRHHLLGPMEAASAKARESLLSPKGLKIFLEASPVYLRVKETRTDAEAPTIQERLASLLRQSFEALAADERGALIMAVLPDLAECSVLCELFRAVEGNWSADGVDRPPEQTYFGGSTPAVRDALFAKVRGAAKKGTLWTQGSPTAILWFWWTCGEEQRVYAFIKESMDDPKALAALLDEVVYHVSTPEGDYDVLPVRRWSKLIDFRALEPKAVHLSMNGAVREDRKKARRFVDAFANGKSELFR